MTWGCTIGYYIIASSLSVVDCGVPVDLSGVIIIDSFNNTKFGALITFHCEEDDNSMTAECGSDGEWIPNPASFMCGNSGKTFSGTDVYVDVLASRIVLRSTYPYPVSMSLYSLTLIK